MIEFEPLVRVEEDHPGNLVLKMNNCFFLPGKQPRREGRVYFDRRGQRDSPTYNEQPGSNASKYKHSARCQVCFVVAEKVFLSWRIEMNLIPEWAISYTTLSLSSDHVTVKFHSQGGVKGAKPVKELAKQFAVGDDAPYRGRTGQAIPEWATRYCISEIGDEHIRIDFEKSDGLRNTVPIDALRAALDRGTGGKPQEDRYTFKEVGELSPVPPHREVKPDVWIDVYDVLAAFTGRYSDSVRPMVDDMVKLLLTGGSMADVRDLATRVMGEE